MTGTIGLVAAMAQESQALLRLVSNWKRTTSGKLPIYSFSLSGHPCVLVTSGMGVRRAREAAQVLVEQYQPRLIITFGIAGAVEADLEIGDVVLPEAYCRFEHGAPGELRPLAHWPEPARNAVVQVLNGLKRGVVRGTAVTTTGIQLAQSQLGAMPHPVLEMETAGIATVAAEHGVPLLSLRAISDGPRAPIPLDLGEVMDDDANLKLGNMLSALLHNPRIIFQAGRMMRNTETAARSAALSLAAALSMPDL